MVLISLIKSFEMFEEDSNEHIMFASVILFKTLECACIHEKNLIINLLILYNFVYIGLIEMFGAEHFLI